MSTVPSNKQSKVSGHLAISALKVLALDYTGTISHDIMLFSTNWVASIFSGKNTILTDYSDP